MWFSYISFLIYGFTASLTAILMTRYPSSAVVPYKSFRLMLQDTDYHVQTTSSISTLTPLFKSQVELDVYERITRSGFVSSRSPAMDDKNAINALTKQDSKTVLVMPASVAQYYTSRNCDLVTSDVLLKLSYAFLTKEDSIKSDIDTALLTLRENGRIQQIQNKWMPKSCPENDLSTFITAAQVPVTQAKPLSIADLAIPYILLLIGIVVAIVMLILESVLVKRRRQVKFLYISLT